MSFFHRRLWSTSGVLFILTAAVAHAASLGTAFTHKGEYKPNGVAVTGIYDFQILLFNVAVGGAALGAVIRENVAVSQGQFTVEVNYGAPAFATTTQYWLETRVRSGNSTGAFTVLPVRQKLTAVPYALNVRALPPGVVTGASLAPNAVGTVAILNNSITAADIGSNAVGLTEINPAQVQARVNGVCAVGTSMRAIGQNGTVVCEAGGSNAWRLGGNAGTNSTTQFLGTTDNQPLNLRVNNQRVARFEPNTISPNVVVGNAANFITDGVRGGTIGGGGAPTGDTDPDWDREGPNRVTEVYGTVGGGLNNQAGDNAGTVIDKSFATVGGGVQNTASGLSSTVGGGWGNTASGGYSTVAGGVFNTANGNYSTVGGGGGNTVNGHYSTVTGGDRNGVGGGWSTVAGGFSNVANGNFSFVAGFRARNENFSHHGVFIFADNQNADFFSAGPNTFNVRAQGGAHFNTQTSLFFGAQTRQMLNLWNSGTDNYGIGVQTGTVYFRTANGFAWFRGGAHADGQFDPGAGGATLMRLETNGSLYTLGAVNPPSDRDLKTDFAAVNPLGVLAHVLALPIQSWRYKNDHTTRHLGPVAQDFHAAFGLGADDKHIATVDADGVALAAIQGLHQKLEKENAQLKARVVELEAQAAAQAKMQARIATLEARLEAVFQARTTRP